MSTTRRLARTLGRALRSAADAYAETAWVYRYGPGFAPTAPIHISADPPAAGDPARGVRPLDRTLPNGRGRLTPAAARAGHAAASRSPAHASASA